MKAFEHKTITFKLDSVGAPQKGEVHYVGGALPYLWIGSEENGCYGCVPDKKVRQLRDWCNTILRIRSKI